MYALPKVGSIVSFNTEHQSWYYYEPQKTTKVLRYKNVQVLPPLWEEGGIFFVATGDEKNPIACISIRAVKNMTVGGKEQSVVDDFESDRISYKVFTGSKGNKYTLTLKGEKAIYCSCPGFMFHNGNCKHLREANK